MTVYELRLGLYDICFVDKLRTWINDEGKSNNEKRISELARNLRP